MDFKIIDYGALPDGKFLSTQAIKKAIKACSDAGGGRVIFTKGVYKSGAFSLYDNIELYFEDGAKLIASDNLDDFDLLNLKSENELIDKPTWEKCDYNGKPVKFFIYAKGVSNISITGSGIIDGNEEIFYGNVSKYHIDGYFYPRVPLIFFEDCLNVEITGVTLQRSAFWTVHLVGCKNVEIDSIKILNNLRLANSDGIDPDHCQNVIIRNCRIEAADDCIVFKTTDGGRAYGACENIEVRDCVLISTSAAIKFGTETVSDIKDILIHDCRILNTNRGVSFMLRDEGNIDRVVFKNIAIHTRRFSPEEWWGKAEPIAITAVKRSEDKEVGTINNIQFENIIIDSENGIFIYGEENKNISNISFNNLSIELSDKTKWTKNMHDLRPSCRGGIIETPLSFFYIRNANNVNINNYKMHAYTPMDDLIASDFDVENVDVLNK